MILQRMNTATASNVSASQARIELRKNYSQINTIFCIIIIFCLSLYASNAEAAQILYSNSTAKKSRVCPTIENNTLFYGIIVLHNRAHYHKNY